MRRDSGGIVWYAPPRLADGTHGLTGVSRGVRQDGRIAVMEWVEAAIKASAVTTESRCVNLVALPFYLGTAAEARSVV